MSDRLPGTSWSNPIWHGRYRIFAGDFHPFDFVHDDFDGAPDANDNRYGTASSIEDARQQIDEMEAA